MADRFYYFGCMSEAGHYFFSRDSRMSRDIDSPQGNPWGYSVDGKLCPTGAQTQGLLQLHHKDGWTAIAFWDRSVDERPGSCSVFLCPGTKNAVEMLTLAAERFPNVMRRFNFSLHHLPLAKVAP